MKPLIDAARIQDAQSGRSNSTYAGSRIAGLETEGGTTSFLAGQDYRNQLINQLLARRQSLFGDAEGRIAQTQNVTDINRSNALNAQTANNIANYNQQVGQNLANLNAYNANTLGSLGSLGTIVANNEAQRAASRTGLFSSIPSILNGAINVGTSLFTGNPVSGLQGIASIGRGIGNLFSSRPSSPGYGSPFGDFQNLNDNYAYASPR